MPIQKAAFHLRRRRLAHAFPELSALHAASDGLAISGVRAWLVKEPVSGARYSVLRLETASGIAGFGECEDLQPGDIPFANDKLKGRPATATEALSALLKGRPGLSAAVNMAALDAAARSAKVPLYQFLGGPTRFKVRVFTRVDGPTEAAVGESMNRARGAGYRAFLVQLPSKEAGERLAKLRTAAGAGVDFIVEPDKPLSSAGASAFCKSLELSHAYWVEEPCEASNLLAAKRLSSEGVAPLGFGRSIEDVAKFEDLLREEAIDVVRPALSLHGITGIRKIAAMAEVRYAAVAPYHSGGPVGTAAALHLAAALPNFFIQQIPFPAADQDRRIRESIGGALERPAEGFLPLPGGSGLGIAPEMKALQVHTEVSR